MAALELPFDLWPGSPQSASAALGTALANRLQDRLVVDEPTIHRRNWALKYSPAGRPYHEHRASAKRMSVADWVGDLAAMPPDAEVDRLLGLLEQMPLNYRIRAVGTPMVMFFRRKSTLKLYAKGLLDTALLCASVHLIEPHDSLPADWQRATDDRAILSPALSGYLQGFPRGWVDV